MSADPLLVMPPQAADFDEIYDATMPWDAGLVVMMRAYLDSSVRQSGVSSVAAVAFGIDRAKKAEREWRKIFGERRCHMTDLHARRGAFSGISSEEAGSYCRHAIDTINKYASLVVVVSCDVAEIERLRPRETRPDAERLLDSARSAYNCGLHWAMGAMGWVLSEREQRIQYWFERGDNFQGSARRFMETINGPDAKALREYYCYGSDAFVSKEDAHLFEAADVVAWEWAKHIDRVREGKRARPSLAALMDGPCIVNERPFHLSSKRYGNHFTGAPLERFFKKMNGLFQATSVAEIDAIVREQS